MARRIFPAFITLMCVMSIAKADPLSLSDVALDGISAGVEATSQSMVTLYDMGTTNAMLSSFSNASGQRTSTAGGAALTSAELMRSFDVLPVTMDSSLTTGSTPTTLPVPLITAYGVHYGWQIGNLRYVLRSMLTLP